MNAQERVDALRRAMSDNGIDLLVALHSAQHHIEQPDPVFLISGFRPLGRSLALLDKAGDTALIVSPAWDEERATSHSRTAVTRGDDDPVAALQAEVQRRGVPSDKVGIVGLQAQNRLVAGKVAALFDGKAKLADDLLEKAGGRKSEEEIVRATKAADVAERGFERLLEIAHPGMPECDLAAELNWYMKSLGADDNFLMLSASQHNRAVQPSSGHRLEKGDIILAEMTPSVEGQFAQICRTAVVGPASDVLAEKYALVVRAMRNGIDRAVVGNTVADICYGINEVLEEQGYGEYCFPPHIRRRGHALGFSTTVPGSIAIDNEQVLEEDMFFVVHPNQYLPETGYLLCGEPVHITANGPRVLSRKIAALGVVPL